MMDITMPVEDDLVTALRAIAEHNTGMFPKRLGKNEFMAGIELDMDKIAAKYGGKEKLKEKYGKQPPAFIIAEVLKATQPLVQKQMRGITFYEACSNRRTTPTMPART